MGAADGAASGVHQLHSLVAHYVDHGELMSKKSIYILSPMYGGQLMQNYHNSFIGLVLLCRDMGIDIGWSNIWNESLVSRARNRAVDNFLRLSDHTHCIFIDSDIGFDPRDVIEMLNIDKPILGVPCTKKSINWNRIQTAVEKRLLEWVETLPQKNLPAQALLDLYKKSGREFPPQELPRIGGDFVMNFQQSDGNRVFRLDQPESMMHVGTGMLMVKREVFMKFKEHYPDRWYESRGDVQANPGQIFDFFHVGINEQTREYDSEDFWFIHDCMALGYEAFLLPKVKTTHMGTHSFDGDLIAAVQAVNSYMI